MTWETGGAFVSYVPRCADGNVATMATHNASPPPNHTNTHPEIHFQKLEILICEQVVGGWGEAATKHSEIFCTPQYSIPSLLVACWPKSFSFSFLSRILCRLNKKEFFQFTPTDQLSEFISLNQFIPLVFLRSSFGWAELFIFSFSTLNKLFSQSFQFASS